VVFGQVEEARFRRERSVTADAVDRAVPRRRHQPGARARGRPVAGPALGGDRECLLGGFFGEVEVAEEADQGGEDAAPLVAEDLIESRWGHCRAHGHRVREAVARTT
jgi:hypothetical protein